MELALQSVFKKILDLVNKEPYICFLRVTGYLQ